MSTLVALLLSAQAPPPVETADPASLVRSVCLADSVALPAKQFADIPYKKLPRAARAVLNRVAPGFVPHRMVRQMNEPLAAAEVPNRILVQLARKQVFLILPAPAASGLAAQMCAVAWKGKLSEAGEFLPGMANMPSAPATGPLPGQLQIVRTNAFGVEIAAAEYNGWAIIGITPETALEGEKG